MLSSLLSLVEALFAKQSLTERFEQHCLYIKSITKFTLNNFPVLYMGQYFREYVSMLIYIFIY